MIVEIKIDTSDPAFEGRTRPLVADMLTECALEFKYHKPFKTLTLKTPTGTVCGTFKVTESEVGK